MLSRFRKDPISIFCAGNAGFHAVGPSAAYLHYPDYRVLALLLAQMLVVAGLQDTNDVLLISSVASLISYKLYVRMETACPASYPGAFTALNLLFLVILIAAEALLK